MRARNLAGPFQHNPVSANRRRILQVAVMAVVLGVVGVTDIVVGSSPEKQQPATKQYIVASGIKGTLVLCGAGDISSEAIDQFAKSAGEKKGRVVLLSGPDASKETEARLQKLKDSLDAKGLEDVAMVAAPAQGPSKDEGLDSLKKATGVWLVMGSKLRELLSGSPLGTECQALLKRGGVIAAAGGGAEALSQVMLSMGDNNVKTTGLGLLPDTIIVARAENGRPALLTSLKENPGLVGIELAAGSTLVATGRTVRSIGVGQVSVHLAASGNRKALVTNLDKKKGGDLTTLRRSAVTRADSSFPPVRPKDPVVEKGSLVIVGGGNVPQEITDKFFELAGGKDSHMIIFPQAGKGPGSQDDKLGAKLAKMGAKSVTVIAGREKNEVEKPEFIEAMKKATGIWFHGGRQGLIVDALENTVIHELMYEVLNRDGVIGGSSAGASIQCEYLVRGSPGAGGNMFEGYERGFGFLQGVAVDQHFAKRKRFGVMTELMKTYPQFLGIGIDESTAIIVRGHIADVMGKDNIHVYDTTKPVEQGKPDYEIVPSGGRYDLKARKVIPVEGKKAPSLLRLNEPIWERAPIRVLELGLPNSKAA